MIVHKAWRHMVYISTPYVYTGSNIDEVEKKTGNISKKKSTKQVGRSEEQQGQSQLHQAPYRGRYEGKFREMPGDHRPYRETQNRREGLR